MVLGYEFLVQGAHCHGIGWESMGIVGDGLVQKGNKCWTADRGGIDH